MYKPKFKTRINETAKPFLIYIYFCWKGLLPEGSEEAWLNKMTPNRECSRDRQRDKTFKTGKFLPRASGVPASNTVDSTEQK